VRHRPPWPPPRRRSCSAWLLRAHHPQLGSPRPLELVLALTRRVSQSRAGNAAAPPLAARRRRSPAADRHRPAALAAVPRRSAAGWPCRRAAVPLSPRRRAVDKAAAGAPAPVERRGRGRRARGLRVRAAAAVPDAREGSACRPPLPSQTRAWAPRAGPGARRAGRRGRAPRGGRAGRRRVGGGGDEARGWGTRMAWRDGPLNC